MSEIIQASLIFYFAFGSGFYSGMAIKNPQGFVNANLASLFRGWLLCFLFWPFGLLLELILIAMRIADTPPNSTKTVRER